MSVGWVDRTARTAVLRVVRGIDDGSLSLTWPGGGERIDRVGGIHAALDIHDARFFRRVLFGGEIGLGESYVDGQWSSPDLVDLVALMLANRAALAGRTALPWWPWRLHDRLAHFLRRTALSGRRRSLAAPGDLGHAFFSLFLDDRLMHSCALYDSPRDSLESAQARSLRSICEQLELGPGDRVLEIGTGWGALAEFAATHYGCHITTTTVSRAQYDVAQQRLRGAGVRPDQVAVRLEDYRAVRGRFDKIVSIEMFETVGLDHYDTFFEACDRMLLPHGTMLLQTSTVDDWRFGDYLRTPSWAATYIFPGVELASVSRILASLARLTTLRLESITQLESHYALTVREWRRRFLTRAHDARALGFGDEFIRAWDLYLACCEAAFRSYHIGNAQLLLAKPGAVAAAFARPKCAVA